MPAQWTDADFWHDCHIHGVHGTKARLEDIRLLLEENDIAAALSQLKELAAALSGDVQPPRTD
ncbi:MAG TPA: hypothetical protein VH253_11720 [Phycisphaerae bacterium]|nr:hypothetical protein [Phycisphaerae bacterium]